MEACQDVLGASLGVLEASLDVPAAQHGQLGAQHGQLGCLGPALDVICYRFSGHVAVLVAT